MELDDLKQTWNKTNKQTINRDIMNIIQHKNSGPVASLNREFLKPVGMMLIVPIIFISMNLKNIEGVFTSVLFWSYIGFYIVVVIFSYYSLQIVKQMQVMDGMVKANLEKQISLLETRLRWKMIGLPVAMLFFVILFEVVPYFQDYKMLNTWHSLSPLIRFGIYAAMFLFQYLIAKRINKLKFQNNIDRLKQLVKEME